MHSLWNIAQNIQTLLHQNICCCYWEHISNGQGDSFRPTLPQTHTCTVWLLQKCIYPLLVWLPPGCEGTCREPFPTAQHTPRPPILPPCFLGHHPGHWDLLLCVRATSTQPPRRFPTALFSVLGFGSWLMPFFFHEKGYYHAIKDNFEFMDFHKCSTY